MENKYIDELYDKLSMLEKKRISYMEVDKNASAGRIARQIRQIELEIETLEHNEKIKEELLIYKEAVSHYPDLKIEIENKLKKQKEYEI